MLGCGFLNWHLSAGVTATAFDEALDAGLTGFDAQAHQVVADGLASMSLSVQAANRPIKALINALGPALEYMIHYEGISLWSGSLDFTRMPSFFAS